MRSSVLVLAVPLLALPAIAQAHFTLLAPPPASNSTNGGKGDPPCGPPDMPSNVVTPVMGGSKLMLKVNETVYHPGFYRIALAIKSRSELPADNVVKDASGKVLPPAGPGNSATADYQTGPRSSVAGRQLVGAYQRHEDVFRRNHAAERELRQVHAAGDRVHGSAWLERSQSGLFLPSLRGSEDHRRPEQAGLRSHRW